MYFLLSQFFLLEHQRKLINAVAKLAIFALKVFNGYLQVIKFSIHAVYSIYVQKYLYL